MSQEKQILESIIKIGKQYTEGRHYGKEYHNAKSIDELLYIASEPLGLATINIFFALQPPKRGELVLRILKSLKPRNYYKYWDVTNTLSTESLFYILEELNIYFSSSGVSISQDELDCLCGYVASFLSTTAEYSKEEEKMFMSVLTGRMTNHTNTPMAGDEDPVGRLLKRLGKDHMQKKALVSVLKETVLNNPLHIAEPHILLDCYKKLKNS